MSRFTVACFVVGFMLFVTSTNGLNKYSEEAQVMAELVTKDRPYRMQKLNLLWDKARKRLSPDKLKMLHTELKMQDKEEITWKRLKAEGQDKDGLLETDLRRKLRGIMHRYDLIDQFPDVDKVAKEKSSDSLANEALDKSAFPTVFSDKKLNRLWEKAERAGFSEEELKTLKEEFRHHQEKIENYYQFMETVSMPGEMDNSVDSALKAHERRNDPQALKDKHRELKRNYERLGKIAATGPADKDFDEQKVADLWKLAQNASFTSDELDSLKEELRHYEHRVRKLQHMEAQVELAEASNKWTEHNAEDKKRMEQKIKQYSHKINKIHGDIEGRILQRHLEL